MSDSRSRWRRLALLAAVLGAAALVVRRQRRRAGRTDGDATGDTEPASPDEVAVELDRVSVGDDLSVATGGLDPTVAAEVLELNVRALETVEEAWVRDTVDAALAGDTDLDEVEERLSEQVRENEVTDTAIDELESFGFRGLLDFGSERQDWDDEDDATGG